MFIIKLNGGLGNQLFEYAAAYSLAQEHDTSLMIDDRAYNDFDFTRQYCLSNFKTEYTNTLIHNSVIRILKHPKLIKQYRRFLLTCKYRVNVVNEIEEYTFQKIIPDPHKNTYLIGFWQSYLYFHKYREQLVNQFKLKDYSNRLNELITMAHTQKPIAMHIRRGDYVAFRGGKCLSISYYNQAMQIMRQEYKITAPIWVFTDDIPFCQKTFAPELNLVYICENESFQDIEEFSLMTNCSSFIIANSSFSWWAAYLSDAPDKSVIAPVVDMWKSDFYLPEWKKIPAIIE